MRRLLDMGFGPQLQEITEILGDSTDQQQEFANDYYYEEGGENREYWENEAEVEEKKEEVPKVKPKITKLADDDYEEKPLVGY